MAKATRNVQKQILPLLVELAIHGPEAKSGQLFHLFTFGLWPLWLQRQNPVAVKELAWPLKPKACTVWP